MLSVAASCDMAGHCGTFQCTPSKKVFAQATAGPTRSTFLAAPLYNIRTSDATCQPLKSKRPSGGRLVAVVCKVKDRGTGQRNAAQIDSQARIRSEVIAPFRTLRLFFYIAFMASAGLGGAITLTRLIGALGGAPNADPLPEVLKNLGIDGGAFAVFAFLWVRDKAAEKKSISRITREETLSGLRIELANKRVVSVGKMRGTCRLLVLSGTRDHIQAALERAEPFKQALVERGVLVVPVYREGGGPFKVAGREEMSKEGENGGAASDVAPTEAELKASAEADKRFIASPIYTNEWKQWLEEQMKLANVAGDKPIYISLRLDGRVRASGVGFPPFEIIAAQLPPMRGIWAGPLDGMDGQV